MSVCAVAGTSAPELLDTGAPWPKYRVDRLELPDGVADGKITAFKLADLDGDHLLDLLVAWHNGENGVLAAYEGGAREWRIEHEVEYCDPVVVARTGAEIRHVAVADMDWDGSVDVVMALDGRSQLEWFSLESPQPVEIFEIVPLPGPVTVLTALDYGRRNSVPSPVVGVLTAAGPQLALFPDQKPPVGQPPLLVPTGGVVRETAAGNLDGDAWWDLVIATDGGVAVIAGTDSGSRMMAREMSVTKVLVNDESGASIALDRFERSTTHRLAVAGLQGLRLVDPQVEEWSESLKTRALDGGVDWVRSAWSGVGRGPALVLPDDNGVRLYGALDLDRTGEWRALEETTLELGGRVATAETGRISRDAMDDLVVVLSGSNQPLLLVAAPRVIFGLTTNADHDDGSCDADCTLREAINAANANPGFDEIRTVPGLFDMGFHPAIQLPTLTDPVRLNEGTWQWWIHGDACVGGCNGLVITGDACALERVKVYNFDKTPTGQSGKGIVLLGSYHSWLEFVESDNNEGHGIVFSDATDTSLRGSFTFNHENGIHLDPGSMGTTANNHAWGVSAIANFNHGIRVDNVPDTMIGGTTTGASATVEQNTLTGISVSGLSATGTTILRLIRSFMGTQGNGDHGVFIVGAGATSVGSPVPAAKCLIEANAGSGVRIETSSASHQIANAEIFDNGAHGVLIAGAGNVGIGPDVAAFENAQNGVFLTHDGVNDSYDITIEDSVLGSSENSVGSTGNTGYGIGINGASGNTIGTVGHGNVISMNGGGGIWMGGAGATGNNFRSNYIGTDELGSTISGNDGPGITIVSAPSNRIGGVVNGGNVITQNLGDGIVIGGDDAVHIGMRFNSIHHNTGQGIDLGSDGSTFPDPDDVDTGPNFLVNQPTPVLAESCGGTTFILGQRFSGAGVFFHDIYANTGCDRDGWGEGETYLDSFSTSHSTAGTYRFSVDVPGDNTGLIITAQTTAFFGSSSEFSNCVEVIAGRAGDTTADCVFAADDFADIVNLLDDPSYVVPGNPDADLDGDVDVDDLRFVVVRALFETSG